MELHKECEWFISTEDWYKVSNSTRTRPNSSGWVVANSFSRSKSIQFNFVPLKSSVNNLGVIFNNQLFMREHVRHVCQLRQLRVVWGSLTFEASAQLVHAFINSRLDYCNSLLAGVSDQLIGQLQSVLRTAARLVIQKKKYDHISDDIRNKLHWLHIRQRISFKLCLLVFRCLRGEAPPYLTEMLSLASDSDSLRSHPSAAYLFIYFKIHLACINVYNQYFKNLLYCQPETTKRVVTCFSRLLNLDNEQLSILEFKYNFNLHTIIKYIHAQSKILRMMNLIPQRTL